MTRFRRLAPFVCALMMISCAALRPTSAAAPPRLETPSAAGRPCDLHRLPSAPTLADLEAGYMIRGAQLVACDGARRLALETLQTERDLIDRWRRQGGRH